MVVMPWRRAMSSIELESVVAPIAHETASNFLLGYDSNYNSSIFSNACDSSDFFFFWNSSSFSYF